MSRTYRTAKPRPSKGNRELAVHLRYRIRDGQFPRRNTCGCWACDYCESNRLYGEKRRLPIPYDEEEE